MNLTRHLLALLILVSFANVGSSIQSDWKDLYNGKSLDGWVQRGGKANYEAVGDKIVGTTAPNTPNSFLCTKKSYSDFELQLQFQVHPELNSGIQIRSESKPDYQNGRVHGYQIEIDPSDRAWTAGIYDEGRRGWLDDLSDNQAARYAFEQGKWNDLRVLAIGDRIQTWLNGVPAGDLTDSMTPRGFIALQVHGVGKRTDPLTVSWRKIRINENPKPDRDESEILGLIPEAAAMPHKDFIDLATNDVTPTPDKYTNKSLTLELLALRITPDDNAQSRQEFDFTEAVPDPAELAREINRGAGNPTFIKANRITGARIHIEGDRAKGTCSFEVPATYKGRVNFEASKSDDAWKIVEFSMPARGIKINLDKNGKWSHAKKGVFDEDAEVNKLADGFKFTEGPALGPDGRIYFNDIPNQRTHVFDRTTGKTSVFRENTGKANGLFFTPNDALLSCEGGSRQVTRRWRESEQQLASQYSGTKLNSPNDLVLDTVGGIYFTDPRYGNRDDMEMEIEGVYYLPRGGKLMRLADDIKRPNGIILSPDFKILYVADTGGNKIWAFDVKGPGKIENKREFFGMGSDGMSIDSAGNVYLTTAGSIVVVDPAGKEIERRKMPENPSNCLLVGNTLFVTARTGFYSVRTNSTGIAN